MGNSLSGHRCSDVSLIKSKEITPLITKELLPFLIMEMYGILRVLPIVEFQ